MNEKEMEEMSQEEHAEMMVSEAIDRNSEEVQRKKYGDKE